MLVPLLFSLYNNDLPGLMKAVYCNSTMHRSKVLDTHYNTLLYVDVMILLSYSQVGLHWMLSLTPTVIIIYWLLINQNKKGFRKHHKNRWLIDGEPKGQLNTLFRIVFSEIGSWLSPHQKRSFRAKQCVNWKWINHAILISLIELLKYMRLRLHLCSYKETNSRI